MAKSIEVTLKLNDRDFKRGIRSAQTSLRGLNRTSVTSTNSFRNLGVAVSNSIAPLVAAGAGLGALGSALGSSTQASQKFTGAVSKVNQQVLDTFFEFEDASESVKDFGIQMDQTQRKGNGLLGTLGRFAGFAAVIGGLAVAFQQLSKSIGVAAEFETIEITLSNLTGSAEKGAKALEVITEKAQELPFAFSDLAGASPVLLTVSKNLEEFQQNIQLAADIAANFGIPFEQAASSLQRAFSAGAAAADVFREKGVLSAAGFQAGVSYSVDETIAKFREFGVSIDGVSRNLNQSLTGAASQAGDALTLFQRELGNAIKPELTSFLLTITNLYQQNKTDIDALARSIGTGAVNAFIAFARAGALIIDVIKPVATLFGNILGGAINLAGGLDKLVIAAVAAAAAIKAIDVANKLAITSGTILQGVTGVGLVKVTAGIAAAGVALAAANKLLEDSLADQGDTGFFDTLAGLDKIIEDIKNGVKELPPAVEAGSGDLKTFLVDIANLGSSAADATEDTRTALQKFRDDLDLVTNISGEEYKAFLLRLEELYKTGAIGIEEYRNLLRDLDEQFGQNEGLNNFLDTLGSAQKSLSEDLANAFIDGKDAMESFKNFFKTIITQIIADIIRLSIIQPILGALLAPFGFGFATGGNIVKLPAPKRFGGPVVPGGTYLVGEEGPELLHMGSQGGTITPNHRMGGATNITYNINAVDAPSFQQLVARDPEFIYNVSRMGARRTPGG